MDFYDVLCSCGYEGEAMMMIVRTPKQMREHELSI